MARRIQDLRSGRQWFGVEVNRVLDLEWLDLPRDVLGHWLVLFAYSARQGGGGRIRGPDGKPPKEFCCLGIESRDIEKLVRHGLVRRAGKYLEIVDYDVDREERFQTRREEGREAAKKRWGQSGGSPAGTCGNASGNARGIADQRRAEKKTDPPKAPQGGHDACADDPKGFRAFWAALPPFLQQRRSDAVREWRKTGLDRDEVTQQRIVKALERQSRTEAWLKKNRGLNLTPKMYLRKRRWEDGPDPLDERTTEAAKRADRRAESRDTPEEREARWRAGWEADPANEGKPYPGMKNAMAEIVRDAVERRGNTQ
jgi:hypothetical protein